MATGSNMNFDEKLQLFEEQMRNLQKLFNENIRLNESPFNKTTVDKLNELSEKVNEFKEKLNVSLKEQKTSLDSINKSISRGLFKDSENVTEDIEKALERIEKLRNKNKITDDEAKDAIDKIEKIKNSAVAYYSIANREQEALNKQIVEGYTFLDEWGERFEQRTRALRKGTNEISNGAQQIYASLKKTLEPWAKANQEAMSYARTMGMSQKTADAYLANTVSWASKNNIGLLFNKTTDELIKMQGKYSEVVGRNIQLTSEQKKDMLALETIIGEDGMLDIANNLENFGLGMSDSAEFVKKTYDEATKKGIAASKLTKTIRENIKMAQNYSFKNGLEGLSNMARKAVELKTDMSFVNGFIDKVSTVEGAITTGANLQVLGGNYAIGSDPISMLHESLNNVEGLFDRAVGMAQGKVFYNNDTGNFEMGAMDRYLMKQAATQMGIDPSKMIDVAFRKASLDRIEGQAKLNSNISNDEEMMSLVKNLATWDNGKAVVDIDGKSVNVEDLKKEHKDKLEAMQRTDSQNLQEMAIHLRSMNEIISGTQKEINNEQANITSGIAQGINNILKTNTEMLDNVAKIGAWFNVINGSWTTLFGILTVINGSLRTINGFGNLFRRGRTPVSGKTVRPGYFGNGFKRSDIGFREKVVQQKSTGKLFTKRGGKYYDSSGNPVTNTNRIKNLDKYGIVKGSRFTNFTKAIGKGVGGGALLGGAISLGGDIITGEFKKDIEGSLGRAAGTTIGAAIGGVFGPIGAMVGGWLGATITNSIQDAQKRTRDTIRKEIANKLSATAPQIASLFTGPNAIQGNYSKSQLLKLKEALNDGRIDDSDDLGWFLKRKLRANNDLVKISDSGIDVAIEMANGGVVNNHMIHSNKSNSNVSNIFSKYANGGKLEGKSHANGGMPILGSNIIVEGGEYVINKQATKDNLPLLERINSGEYRMTPKEPLGKQMKVYNSNTYEKTNTYNNSKLDIQPISINLSGTIKLDSGNKQFDISNEILNNPQLISKLTEMINKQINILDNGSYNKGIFRQKFV